MKTSLPLALAAALLVSGLSSTAVAAPAEPSTGPTAPAPRTHVSAKAGLSAPAAVQVGARFTIKGKVKVRGPKRTIKASLGKKVIAKTKANRRGKFTLRLRAGSTPGAATYVVSARKTTGLKAYKRTVRVAITAAPSTAVTSNWPSTAVSVPLGQTIPVSGVVAGSHPAGRTVVVQQLLGGAWVDRASTTSAADGTYATALPGSWLFSSPARIVVKAAGAAPEAAGPEVSTKVTPTWTPGGATTSWVPVYDGRRTRINPCETIEYRTNFASAPAFAREALADALVSVSQASGVTFVNLGDTNAIGKPEPGYAAAPADTDLLIAWVYDHQTTASQPPTNGGVAIHESVVWGKDAVGQVYFPKKLGVNMNAGYHRGWNRTLMTHVYRHELGHIIGLGHPTQQDQVMGAGEALSTNFAWGAGDLAGFAQLGLQGGCVTSP